jgi:predicted membrane-bound mannosyltransferase
MSLHLRRDIAAIIGVIWLAFGLRLLSLADANIWWDEGWSVWLARQSVLGIARGTAADVHPPLYYWLLHAWQALAGESEFAVRFLSVAAGTLTVVALWYLGRLLLPGRRWVAVAASAF